ncbi:MAG: enoyl-CoA hydratase-related protein [Calditrichia bacterium]
MESKNLKIEISDKIATITITRSKKLNALNAETITELYQVAKRLKENEEVGAIIITGEGDKAFVAGAEISEITKHDDISGKIFSLRGQKVFRFIERLGKPVIAAINGYALGGGFELAQACHIRIASEKAKFGQPEVNLGLVPGYGGTQRLPRLIGQGPGLYYLLTGEMFDAKTALQFGLVSDIVPLEQLLPRAKEIARLILSKGPLAIQHILKTVIEGADMGLDAGLNLEAESFGFLCGSEDMKEGTSAFLEKRQPNFKGK